MAGILFASWTHKAQHEAESLELHRDCQQAMELIGNIADHDFYYGPLDTKLQLIELLVSKHVKPGTLGKVMIYTRQIAGKSDLDDHGPSIELLAHLMKEA